MPRIVVKDPHGYLGLGASHDLSFSNALQWLAIATAPSPRSRYRPASRWTMAKYSTVCDPRRAAGPSSIFVTNPGIFDLDPHQKTVLSDDIGMALALGLIDEQFGIAGLVDVYAHKEAGHVQLKNGGRHRKMPDFVLRLRNPIRGSTTVLLECKGSVIPGRAVTQLSTACGKQLGNVAVVDGASARRIPKIAVASELALGYQAVVHIDDPDEVIEPPAPDQLAGNLLALEYSFFGDLKTANRIWKEFDLPIFADRDEDLLPEDPALIFNDEAITSFRPRKFHVEGHGSFEEKALTHRGYALTKVSVQAPPEMKSMRNTRVWISPIQDRSQEARSTSERFVTDSPTAVPRREIVEASMTSTGLRAESRTTVWFEQAA